MNLKESNPSEDVILKEYSNYNNIRQEINRERELHSEVHETILPSFTLSKVRYSRRISRSSNYSSKFFDSSSCISGESTDRERLHSPPEKDVLSETELEDDVEITRSEIGKKYEEKFKKRTAELQNEIDKLKSDREHDMDESLDRIDSLEEMLKQERKINSDKFHGLVSHYETIMQQTNNLKNLMLSDYDHVEAKMADLKEKVRSMQTQLQSDLSTDFDNLLEAMHGSNEPYVPFIFSTNECLTKLKDKVPNVTFTEGKNKTSSKRPQSKKQQKLTGVKTRKVHCPRKEKEQT